MESKEREIILTKQFDDALVWATNLHQKQTRKGTNIPYISHLMAVSSIVFENGGDEEEAIAALLHDAAEDQGGQETLDKIRRVFGNKVADIVDDCSDAWTEPKPEWKYRKEKYLEKLPDKNRSSQLVSLADKLHNARAILLDYRTEGEKLWDRFNGGKDDTLWYYRELANIFKADYGGSLADELERVVHELELLATNLTNQRGGG